MHGTSPFWQTFVLLLMLSTSLIGLVFHFFPGLKNHARDALARLRRRASLPPAAQPYTAPHLPAQRDTPCGGCSGCGGAPTGEVEIIVFPKHRDDSPHHIDSELRQTGLARASNIPSARSEW